jgi:thymidylate synthase ThyX
MTKAKIIADSISEQGIRITTLELEFERFLLPQFNTHRQFSRSAQSSRAVPVQKMIDALQDDSNSNPLSFMKNESGMQSSEYLNDDDYFSAFRCYENAKADAIKWAINLNTIGVHKQWANRLLEPFSTVKVVVTATEWDNFFDLRLHHAAQPEMQVLAQAMKTALDESTPVLLDSTLWHLPYVSHDEYTGIGTTFLDLALISAARCARVSYLNHDNSTPDIEKDLLLAQRLLADKHLSPFEHQAKPIYLPIHSTQSPICLDDSFLDGVTHIDKCGVEWSGNFKGWIQHRHLC